MMKTPLTAVLLLAGTIANSASAKSLRGAELDQKHRELLVAPYWNQVTQEFSLREDESLYEPAPGYFSHIVNNNANEDLVLDDWEEVGVRGYKLKPKKDGKLEYEPSRENIAPYTDKFRFRVCLESDDMLCSGWAWVKIHVTRDPNRPFFNPDARNVHYNVYEGESLTVPGNNRDFLDRGVISYGGEVEVCDSSSDSYENDWDIDDDGSFTYQAQRCWIGTESFAYHACYADYPEMQSNQATVYINVNQSPSRPGRPQARDDRISLMEQPEGEDPVELCNILDNDSGTNLNVESSEDDLDNLDGPDSDGCFEYFAKSGDLGMKSFTYTVCVENWECIGCDTATVQIEVTENPNKPKNPPTPRSQHAIEVKAGERYRGNIFDFVAKDGRYNLEATGFSDPPTGLLNTDDEGNFEYGNAPVGQETFQYTVCYKEWPDLCSTGDVTMVTGPGAAEAGADGQDGATTGHIGPVDPQGPTGTVEQDGSSGPAGPQEPAVDSGSRRGVSTLYEIRWFGMSEGGCATPNPSPTITCNGEGEVKLNNFDPNDNNFDCWFGETGHLHCPAMSSGVVHVECNDGKANVRNPHYRQVIASLGSSEVTCDGGKVSHTMGIKAYCNEEYVDYDISYCSGTKLDNNGADLCSQEATATSTTVKVADLTLTSRFDNTCIVTPTSKVPTTKIGVLERAGNDGEPKELFPLKECQGDCDDDSECAGNLVCFKRDDGQVVPNCMGTGADIDEDTDFCVRLPSPDEGKDGDDPLKMALVGDDGDPEPFFPLEECQGDCDDDEDCDVGLLCFQRDGMTPVPGCKDDRSDYEDKDFCYRP